MKRRVKLFPTSLNAAYRQYFYQQVQHPNQNFSSSVNKDEIAKFSSVGESWWDPSSSKGTGPLHSMNPARVDFIRRHILQNMKRNNQDLTRDGDYECSLRGLRVLDVGCGGGLLAESLSRIGLQVTAIDPSPSNIRVAQEHSTNLSEPNVASIDYKCMTVEEMALSGQEFDIVCALEVIEHVDSVPSFIAALSACLRKPVAETEAKDCTKKVSLPTPSIFISTLNRTPKSYALAIIGAEYVTGMVPIGTHDWNKFLTPSEIIAMLNSHSFRTIEVNGLVPECVESARMISNKIFSRSSSTSLSSKSPTIKSIIDPFVNGPISKWSQSAEDCDVNYILYAEKT